MSKVVEVVKDTGGDLFGFAEKIFDETIGALWDSLTPDIPEQEVESLAKGLQKGIDQPRRVTFGRDRVGGVIAHQTTVTRDKKEFVQLIVLISGAPIDALEGVYIADKPINTYPSESWDYSLSDGYHTTANAKAVQKMEGWTSAHIGFGQAHIFIELENNREVFPDGIGNCEFLIRGCKVYDPRDENQLADDNSTWLWTDNAVLNTLHYIRYFGAQNVPLSRLPLDWWIAAANVCDEEVTFKTSDNKTITEKRYCISGTFQFTSNPLEVLSKLEASFAGKVFRQMGQWFVRVGAWYGEPTVTIEQSDIHGDIKIKWHPDLRNRANIVRATFNDPKQNYERTDATPIESQNYKENDGQPLEKSISLPFVKSETQVQRIALVTLEQSRLGSIELPLKHTGLRAAVGKTITLNLPRESIINKTYRVTERKFRLDGGVTLLAVEDSAQLWGDNIIPIERDLTPNSSYTAGELLAPTSINAKVNDSQIRLSWSHPAPKSTNGYTIDITQSNKSIFKSSSDETQIQLPALQVGQYIVYIRAKNVFGKLSNPAALQFSVTKPTLPIVELIAVKDDSVSLMARTSALGLGTHFIWQFLGPSDNLFDEQALSNVRADVFNYQGLTEETHYKVRCKTSNISGSSNWVTFEFVTAKYQDIFINKVNEIPLEKLTEDAQNAINSIPTVQSTLDSTLEAFNIHNSSVKSLKESFNRLGLDVSQNAADLSKSFTDVLESFADTNEFVYEINEKIGQMIISGSSKVAYDEFRTYQLKVDAFSGQFKSTSERITATESSLNNVTSKIEQHSETLELLVGNTDFSETLTKVNETSIRLDATQNRMISQSFAAQSADFATLESLLNNDLTAIDLLEKEIDAAVSLESRDTQVDALRARATALENIVSSFSSSLSQYSKNVNVLSTVNEAAATLKQQLSADIEKASAIYENNIETVVNDNNAHAKRTEALEAKVDLEGEETVKSIAQSIAAAQVSYCSIGRDADGNPINNRRDCEAINGTWIENAPISELLHAVKVKNLKGESVTALSYLTALEDENGKLQARAFFGVDNNGKSGILVYNSQTGELKQTTLDLSADNILFRGIDGKPVISLNTETKNLLIDAEIRAKKLILGDGVIYNKEDLKGEDGKDGATPVKGVDYNDGLNGKDGEDGVTPVKGVDYNDGENGSDGKNGDRGSIMTTVSTSNGVWSNTTANAALPDSKAVTGDVVTIYKSSNVNVATTKKYNGSSWVSPDFVVHGDMIATGTVDGNVIKAHSKVTSPTIESIGSNVMTVTASQGFGHDNQFVEWRGPVKLIDGEIDYNSMRKSNALFYVTVSGDAYFGGQVATSESFKHSASSSDNTATANVTLLGIETRGAPISIIANYSMSGTKIHSKFKYPLITPTVKISIQLLVNGNWITKESKQLFGRSEDEAELIGDEIEAPGSDISESMSGELAFNFTNNDSAVLGWRMIISNREINGGTTYQNLTLKTEE